MRNLGGGGKEKHPIPRQAYREGGVGETYEGGGPGGRAWGNQKGIENEGRLENLPVEVNGELHGDEGQEGGGDHEETHDENEGAGFGSNVGFFDGNKRGQSGLHLSHTLSQELFTSQTRQEAAGICDRALMANAVKIYPRKGEWANEKLEKDGISRWLGEGVITRGFWRKKWALFAEAKGGGGERWREAWGEWCGGVVGLGRFGWGGECGREIELGSGPIKRYHLGT